MWLVVRQPGLCVNGTDVILVNASHVATHYTAGQSTTIASGTWPNTNRYYSFVRPIISCPVPQVAVSNITTTGADLTITPGGSESSWLISINGGGWQTITSSTYTLSGLPSGRNCHYNLRALCGVGDTSFATEGSFVTECAPISQLPYSEDFEDCPYYLSNVTTYAQALPYCWNRFNDASGTANYFPYVTPSSTYVIHGGKSMYWYHTTTSTYANNQYAILPPVNLSVYDISDLTLSFYAKTTATAAPYPQFIVGVLSAPTDTTTFSPLDTITLTSTATLYVVSLANYTGTGNYIAIRCPRTSATRYASLDDIYLTDAWCDAPSNVTATATTDEVTISWTGTGSSYEVILGEDTISGVVGNTYTFNNLSSDSLYNYAIATECTSGTSLYITGSIYTLCEPIVELPYVQNFEALATGSAAAFDNCWNKGTNSSTAYPYVNNYTAESGYGHGLYGYSGGASYWCYAVMPELDASINLSDLELSFDMRRGSTTASYGAHMIVAALPNDTWAPDSTYDTIAVLDATTSTYDRKYVSLQNYNGQNRRIAFIFRNNGTTYNSVYIDNIDLHELPGCGLPFGLTLHHATTDSLVFVWQDTINSGASYIVYYRPADSTEWDIVELVDTIAEIGGLMPATEYDIMVRAYCSDDDTSFALTASYLTLCPSIEASDLPYIENFEAYGSGTAYPISPCWAKGTVNSGSSSTTTNYPYPSSTAINGARSLYFYASHTSAYHYYNWVALPAIDESVNISDLMISFVMKRGSTASTSSATYTSKLIVGVTTDYSSTAGFVPVETIDFSSEPVSSVHNVEVSLENYSGTGRYILLYAPAPANTTTSNYNNFYIDDVVLDFSPTCKRSVNLTVDSLSHDYARLTWENTSDFVDSYHLYYSTQPVFTLDTCQYITVYDTVYELTGLDEETDYYWTVVADCGSGDTSAVPNVEHFRTHFNCGENSINIVETIGEGTSSGYTYFGYNYTSYAKGYSTNIFTVEEMMDMGIMTSADLHSVSVHAGTTACTIPNMKVYAGLIDTTQFTGGVDTSLFANMTLLYNGALTTTAGEWLTINFDTTFHYDGTSNLMLLFRRNGTPSANGTFYYTVTTGKKYTMYGYASSATGTMTATTSTYRVNMMFNMCAEVPSCPHPLDVNVANLSDVSATFTWEAANASYQYVFGPYGFDPDTATAVSTLDTFAVITGLTQNTSYDFYVRNVCDASMISDWSLVTHITTPCAAQTLPYTEDFESYGTGSTQTISPCWVKGTTSTTAYPYPYSTNAVNGARSLYFYAYASSTSTTAYYSYAALPLMQAPVDTLMVTFSIRRYNSSTATYTSRMLVGVMTDPNDINTFVGVDTIDLYTAQPGSIHNFEVTFDSYTGNGQFIAFYDAVPPIYGTNTTCYSYIYLDDITVDYIPSCRRILDIVVDTATDSYANIHWTDPNNASNYEIEYGPEGFTLGNGTTLTSSLTSITLTGLTTSTGYDVYVRPVCSATENGPWSFVTNFRTVCGIYNVPFVEDFESYGSGSSYGIDPCWNKGTSSTTAYPYPYSTAAITGERGLYLYGYYPSSTSTTPVYSYVALPEFNVGVDSLELSFKMKRYNSTSAYYTSRVLVGVMTDPTDITTFVGVDTIDLYNETPGSIHDIVVTFDSYTGTGKHIAIYDPVPPLVGSNTYAYSTVYIDDINVDMASPCGRPHTLHADVTANTITMYWTDTVNSSQWQIEYGPTGFQVGTGTILTVNVNPYTITGLTASTLYDVYVRSMCSSGAVGGNNAGIFTVSTSQMPATLPYYYNFEDATEWSNWQTVSNNSVAWYRGIAEAAEGNYGLYVSTDNGATCNSLHTTITNAAVYRDIDFGSTPSSFEVSFLAKSAGVNDGNYEGINVMLVDPTIPVAASSTSLTSPWGSFNVVHVVRDTNWTLHTLLFDSISGVKRLAFNWYTSTTATHPVWDGAGAIDSLVVKEQSCIRPTNTTVTNVGSNFVSLHWDGPSNATYVVRLRETTGTVNIDNTATTNSITVNNLNPMTHYYVWVYKMCDTNNFSYSAPRIEFATTCSLISAIDTLYEDFNAVTGTAYNTAGILPDCWDGYTNGTTAAYFPHVTNGSSYSYSITGNAITMTSGSATYGNTKIVRLPKFAEPVNTLTLKYWYCTESSTAGTLYVGYMTGFDYENDFVPIVAHPATSASYHSGNGPQPAGTGVFDTVTFDSVPANALFIAFKWYYNSSYYSVCIDNVEVTSSGNFCATPEAMVSSIDYDNATIVINGAASEYEVGIKLATDAIFDDNNDVTINTNTYNFTGLAPQTNYQYRVRGICDSGWYLHHRQSAVLRPDRSPGYRYRLHHRYPCLDRRSGPEPVGCPHLEQQQGYRYCCQLQPVHRWWPEGQPAVQCSCYGYLRWRRCRV